MAELKLNNLPHLPQMETLHKIAPIIWENDEVVALWIIGSLARDAGDVYSDTDLGVVVKPEFLNSWKAPGFINDSIFDGECLGHTFIQFADDAFLHHLVLSNGDIFDFGVYSSKRKPPQEPMILLGCRSESLSQELDRGKQQTTSKPNPASKEEVKELITNFWMNTHKHRKVLHRQLDMLTTVGIGAEKSMLIRLWYVFITGNDYGNERSQGIHGLTEVVQTIQQSMGSRALEIIGASLVNRSDIYRSIEAIRDEVSRVGKALAEKLKFDYPTALEETIRRSWLEFSATYSIPLERD